MRKSFLPFISKIVFSAFVLLPLFPDLKAQAQSSEPPKDNLVYNIVSAKIFPFGLDQEAILISVRDKITLSASPTPQEVARIERKESWAVRVVAREDIKDKNGNVIEPRGTEHRITPTFAMLRDPLEDKLVVLDLGKKFDPAKYAVFITFEGNVSFDEKALLKELDVEFGKSMPEKDEALSNKENWLVRKTNLLDGQESRLEIVSVTIDREGRSILLRVPDSGNLDFQINRYVVRYNQPNFPEFTVGEPKKIGPSKNFVAAKGASDADIYFSGTVASARNSKPVYNYEAKAGYLFSPCVKCGSFGPKASVKAAGESNIDPDSIKATANYEKIFVLAPVTGIILRSDFIGGEFDTSNRTRNLSTGLDAIYVIPTYKIGENNFFTIDFLLGFEGGHNYRHKLDEEGIGNYWRWKLGSNAYFVALNAFGLKKINFSTEYQTRLLNSFEPFTEKIDDKEVTTLRKKPRHYVGSDVDFMFSGAFGVTLKYRYGSLPPAFNFVNHSISLGLTFQLKQANK